MATVLSNPAVRDRLVRKGLEQVRKFNWYRVARNTLAVYYEVFNSSTAGHGGTRQFLPFPLWLELKQLEASKVRPLV